MHTRQRHGGKRAKDPVRTLLRLLAYTFSRYRAAAVFVGLFVILAASANIVSTSRLAPIASELMRSGSGADNNTIRTFHHTPDFHPKYLLIPAAHGLNLFLFEWLTPQ